MTTTITTTKTMKTTTKTKQNTNNNKEATTKNTKIQQQQPEQKNNKEQQKQQELCHDCASLFLFWGGASPPQPPLFLGLASSQTFLSKRHQKLSFFLSLSLYIYIYVCVCVYVSLCVFVREFHCFESVCVFCALLLWKRGGFPPSGFYMDVVVCLLVSVCCVQKVALAMGGWERLGFKFGSLIDQVRVLQGFSGLCARCHLAYARQHFGYLFVYFMFFLSYPLLVWFWLGFFLSRAFSDCCSFLLRLMNWGSWTIMDLDAQAGYHLRRHDCESTLRQGVSERSMICSRTIRIKSQE